MPSVHNNMAQFQQRGARKVNMDAWIMSPRSPTLDAALSILADGKPRSATEIFAEGVKRGLFDPRRQKRRYIYSDLWEYIDRALGVGN